MNDPMTPAPIYGEWLTIKQVCEYLGCGRTTLWRLARRLPIPRVKSEGVVRFKKSSVDKAMSRKETSR
jgi:excisionase family DNA binding protein